MKQNKSNKGLTGDASFKIIERYIIIISFALSLIYPTIALFHYITDKPTYSFALNNPVGWSKNDDIFAIYNYGEKDIANANIFIRSYMVLSGNSNSNHIYDYLSRDSKKIPLEALDMSFQLTGRSKGKIGHITMNSDTNPFANYYEYNSVEFGPNLSIDISNRISDKKIQYLKKNNYSKYDKMNLVIFTIIDNNKGEEMDSLNRNSYLKNIEIYATDYASDYATGETKTVQIDTKTYYSSVINNDLYGVYYTNKDFIDFWNDKNIMKKYYTQFMDELINNSLPSDKKYNY